MKENLTVFSEMAEKLRIPRWNELPDIELYMDQVITLMNKYIGEFYPGGGQAVTSSMINNYVKQGFVPCPVKKKYSRAQLSRLIIICVMKPVLPIQSVGTLIEIMLKTRTEEEMLDYFAENYEIALAKITDALSISLPEISSGEGAADPAIVTAVMQAAAVSGGSKLLAQRALSLLTYTSESTDESV